MMNINRCTRINKQYISYLLFPVLLFAACNTASKKYNTILSPETGAILKSGSELVIDIEFADDQIDSVVYRIDSSVVARRTDTVRVILNTDSLDMGNHLITSKIYKAGAAEEVTSNIILIASKPPEKYGFKIINTFPHDTASYTEGLEYHNGLLYESDGGYADLGGSSLRVVQPETGKILNKVDIDTKYFAEGITIVDQKIIQLTYQERVGFVYDKKTLKKLSEFAYQPAFEGWGLYFDGKQLLNTADGTNIIFILNKDSYLKEGAIEVYDDKGPVNQLNELEVINGKIYCNVYQTDKIVIINRLTGQVEGEIDLSTLYPKEKRNKEADVLNGIAWDAAGKRLFVTGKKWDKLFEIQIFKK